MSDYTVHVVRTTQMRVGLVFVIRIVAGNGDVLFTSIPFEDRLRAVSLAEDFAGMIDGTLVDAS